MPVHQFQEKEFNIYEKDNKTFWNLLTWQVGKTLSLKVKPTQADTWQRNNNAVGTSRTIILIRNDIVVACVYVWLSFLPS